MSGLGVALHRSGKHQEAALYYLLAIELDPGFDSAYLNFADAIKLGADPAPAIARFEREIKRDSLQPMSHFGLGMALRDHDPARAEAAFRKSLALDNTFAMAHNYLGYVLSGRAPADEIIQCYRRAIERDKTFAFPHYNLANVLVYAKGDTKGAIAEYQEAIRLFPEHTFSHLELAHVLTRQRDWKGAALHLRQVIAINPNFADANRHLGEVLLASGDVDGAVEQYRTCVHNFSAWHAGYDGLLLALGRKGANVEGVRLYHEAVQRADKTWPVEVQRRLRYNAACCAVLAGNGSGQDAPPAADRFIFRQQALDWLRAELLAYSKHAGSNPAASVATHETMTHWLNDPDLAPVREADALRSLPRVEEDDWNQLWIDVRRLHAAATPASRPGK